MRIYKFGGTSVADADCIRNVLGIIGQAAKAETSLIVVLSAFQGVTNLLSQMGSMAAAGKKGYLRTLKDVEERHLSVARDLISAGRRSGVLARIKIRLNELEEVLHGVYLVKELTPKTHDYVMSFGEQLSTYIVAEALKDHEIPAEYVDARTIIRTDDQFGRARVDFRSTNRMIRRHLHRNDLVHIVTGFVGATRNRETTTIGRGGSDYTASIIAAALAAEEISIWTDVDGVLTADPRKVQGAFPLEYLSYEEAMELSHFGAKVIYPPTLQPALEKGIPIRIRNTFNPDFKGTVITREKIPTPYLIKGISSIDEIALVRVQGSGMIGVAGIAARIFRALADEKINVILISQASSEHSVCFSILPQQAETAKSALKRELRNELRDGDVSEILVEKEMTIIAVVGENMRHTRGIAGRIFQTLGNNGINISAIAQGSSELNISMVVRREDEARAINTIHSSFFVGGRMYLNLFLTGTGLIGSTFLETLRAQSENLRTQYGICMHLYGIANSRKMYIPGGEIDPGRWKDLLNSSESESGVDRYIGGMKSLDLPNSVFIDCTSSEEIADRYPEILSGAISIVSPSKKANSGSYDHYQLIRAAAAAGRAHFFYETNVGAALPIINTIRDLRTSGDRIHRIEGILSGTLSYLFNRFDGSQPFSVLLRTAQESGYTEPDPRDDLNGMDVARKLLILIRECGYRFELTQIEIQNLVPEEAGAVPIDQLYPEISRFNDRFNELRYQAEQNDRRLRYIASFEKGKARVGLEPVGGGHPFYHLEGTDNVVALYTDYYHDTPLVIKGPGAGAEVTVAGIFGDLLRVANALG